MNPIWYRLELLTSSPEQDSALVCDLGAKGVEIQDSSTFMEDGSIVAPPEELTRIIAYFDAENGSDPGMPDALASREHVRWERYDDTSWQTAWKDYFKPQHLSPRIVVGPPWESFEAPADGVKIEILPGMAFGTGTHETTQLSARAIDQHIAAGFDGSMLDVGCGSAILSIAARMLGVQEIVGLDLDQDILAVARENLSANRIESGVELSTQSVHELGREFDLVVANILAHILRGLRDELIEATRPGGTLIVCGITTEQSDDFQAHFDVEALEMIRKEVDGEWVLLEYERVE